MALPLGKLTLIVGAGLVGSVLAKEGRMSNVSDFFSGAFKVVLKQLKQDDKATSSSKPRNDSLMQQVNSLREELQLLASSRSVTIVTGNRSASGKYGIVVIVVVVGYGYLWWKGWKLPDMMFATRRGLNDACASVAKQLENVYSSISHTSYSIPFSKEETLVTHPHTIFTKHWATKKHLSSRIDRVDCKIDECADNSSTTKEEVSGLRGDVQLIGTDVKSVHHVVRSLETKIHRMEGRQNIMNRGVGRLVNFVDNLDNSGSREQIEGAASSSSRPTLELPKVSPTLAVSLPANASPEPPSPSTANGSRKKHAVLLRSNSSQSEVSASGLKALYGMSDDVGGLISPQGSNGIRESEETNIGSSGAGLFGRFFQRSRSVVQPSKQ